MKPVALVERAIRNSSKSRDIVLDPFGGSGTTLVQALESGCDATGVDIAAFNCLLMRVKTAQYDLPELRAERLLESLPETQRSSFQSVLEESTQQRDDIQRELGEIYQRLGQIQKSD